MFTPRAPKRAISVTLNQLTTGQYKITSAKTIGRGTVKLFTDGPDNFCVDDSPALRSWLLDTFNVSP